MTSSVIEEQSSAFIEWLPLQTPYQWVFHNGVLIEKPNTTAEFSTQQADDLYLITLHEDFQLKSPLYFIHHLKSDNSEKKQSVPLRIIAEKNTKASIIEVFLYQGHQPYILDRHTHIRLKNNANIYHQQFTQDQNIDAGSEISTLLIQQEANSEYQGCLMSFGLTQHHSTIHLELQENNAKTSFNTLMLPIKTQKININVTVHHMAPMCQSQVTARGVAHHRAQSDFVGKIIVAPNACKTRARLENKNLILSKEARVTTQPLLEIYNDDLQCSHGATIGHLDENALFYLRSRGISETQATQMLIDAFIQPILHTVEPSTLRQYIEGIIHVI